MSQPTSSPCTPGPLPPGLPLLPAHDAAAAFARLRNTVKPAWFWNPTPAQRPLAPVVVFVVGTSISWLAMSSGPGGELAALLSSISLGVLFVASYELARRHLFQHIDVLVRCERCGMLNTAPEDGRINFSCAGCGRADAIGAQSWNAALYELLQRQWLAASDKALGSRSWHSYERQRFLLALGFVLLVVTVTLPVLLPLPLAALALAVLHAVAWGPVAWSRRRRRRRLDDLHRNFVGPDWARLALPMGSRQRWTDTLWRDEQLVLLRVNPTPASGFILAWVTCEQKSAKASSLRHGIVVPALIPHDSLLRLRLAQDPTFAWWRQAGWTIDLAQTGLAAVHPTDRPAPAPAELATAMAQWAQTHLWPPPGATTKS